MLATGQPVAVDDFRSDGRVASGGPRAHALGPAVLVPLGPPGNVRGVLTAGRGPGSLPFPPTAVEMVTTFAAQAGIALELAEHRQRRRAAGRVRRTATGSPATCTTW